VIDCGTGKAGRGYSRDQDILSDFTLAEAMREPLECPNDSTLVCEWRRVKG
jgi:hypothetical protein